MIGSMIAWHLNTQMNFDDFVIVDDLINEQQENNFNKRKFIEYIAKDDLEKYLNDKKNVSAVIHMGAISATTESNFNRLLQSNIRFSQALWHWCAENKVLSFMQARRQPMEMARLVMVTMNPNSIN